MSYALSYVQVGCRGDAVDIGYIEPGGDATGVLWPKGDSTVRVMLNYRDRDCVYDLRIYTHSDAIGPVAASFVPRSSGLGDPDPVDVTNNTVSSIWSLVPSSLFARAAYCGGAMALFVSAAWMLGRRASMRLQADRSGSPVRDA